MKIEITTLLVISVAVLASCCKNKETLTRYTVYDEAFGDSLTVDVWTPDGYTRCKKYPVLYMHDGQMLFDSTQTWNHKEWEMDETATRLIAEDSICPIIIVGIHNLPTRLGDYLPQVYYDMMAEGGEKTEMDNFFNKPFRGDAYINAIINTVKPLVDANYSTKKDAGSTCVAGSSMGGLISLYAICTHPEVFGNAMCVSTHFSTSTERPELADAMLQYTKEHMPDPSNHKIYIDNGTQPCDDAYIPFFRSAVELFKAVGYGESNLLYKEFPGHWHSEEYWASRMNFPLKFIFNGESR